MALAAAAAGMRCRPTATMQPSLPGQIPSYTSTLPDALVLQVSMARVYNWDVQNRRQQANSSGDGSGA